MFTVVIPARYSSTRLPGKPLALIANKTMIEHVYQRASASKAKKVVVATDDQRIVDVVKNFGGEVCMTSPVHVSGTDRIHEVVKKYHLNDEEIVVNVQGDEPLIPPAVINQVANNLRINTTAAAATLSEPINSVSDFNNENIVKVVSDQNNCALYFSRAPIPFFRGANPLSESTPEISLLPQRHIGIYAYRVKLLNQFVQWPVATLESLESLEQLRILANAEKIHVSQSVEDVPGGIDTPEDLERLEKLLKNRENKAI